MLQVELRSPPRSLAPVATAARALAMALMPSAAPLNALALASVRVLKLSCHDALVQGRGERAWNGAFSSWTVACMYCQTECITVRPGALVIVTEPDMSINHAHQHVVLR